MYKTLIHSGGEIHLNLENTLPYYYARFDLTSSDKIMEMLLFCDAIKRRHFNYNTDFTVFIPYMPYARADRVIPNGGGDAVGISVMAELLKLCNFPQIISLDVHSDVTTALIPNLTNVKPYGLIENTLNGRDPRVCSFVSPDSGAEKKIYDYCKTFGANHIRATKKRNPQTGEIESITILDTIPEHHFVYVIDDICDGGRTFVELARHLPPDCEPELIVTHGIFSKGVDELGKYYKTIYTTDSFKTCYPIVKRFNSEEFLYD